MGADILLVTINAKWIHPSPALRLLKANLGPLEERCEIMEFTLRQPLREKTEPILAARPLILGFSVSIWNHTATLELLKELKKEFIRECSHRDTGFTEDTEGKEKFLSSSVFTSCSPCLREKKKGNLKPYIVLGGPEVSHLSEDAEIFRYADTCIRGEGEEAFRELCEKLLLNDSKAGGFTDDIPAFISGGNVNVNTVKSGYRLYTDEDINRKLIYAEASRGCPFACDFCLSAVSPGVREFPLEPFFEEMTDLIRRGAKTVKFLDRSFNTNIERVKSIMEFFLEKINERMNPKRMQPLTVHFEMVPFRFPQELKEIIARFPPGSLRLEIGIQTLNPEISARIGRPSDPERELENLCFLRQKTFAIIHADLIAGLPGEDFVSFGRGFDMLWEALSSESSISNFETSGDNLHLKNSATNQHEPTRTIESYQSTGSYGLCGLWLKKIGISSEDRRVEIQPGILKLLPGAPMKRHSAAFGMRYNPAPPYEVIETAAIPAGDLGRIKNFARFWEIIVNRGLAHPGPSPVFDRFMALSDSLSARFGRNWGINKAELAAAVRELYYS